MDTPRKSEPYWLAGLFLAIGAYLFLWVAVAGVREWFALVLLVIWAVSFAVGVRAELAGRTRLAWGLGVLLFLVPWATAGVQFAYITFTSGAGQ
jgi:hypothetical protein